ncbi:DUF3945 domain-containing protein [Chryseobacterium carnipullorum]|uniref:DUF3945 domain-containing protein n=1 Tax=Chryseobacterium carnipullorum TaxID=1124835 RepID=A0A376DS20_CHRCU|nr:DUF3945 domain-containing protein [Chryseobacterium carnipullorum]AZA49487.1 DUF3945 domain-containing protein [Chryseobacterium carnipullorum]AZA64381.1 DUF3945 domain-containing protein [Chryseobacterium carnipullorum]STC94479.1 Uncharacterised protein [Chryseobacterium carnipullorum]
MNKIGNHTAVSEVSTLLVLRHSSNSIGIVQGIEHNGNLIDVPPNRNNIDSVMRIDSAEDSFMDFYSDFYHQLKDPSNYSFFKVREFEAHDTAIDLQEYIDCLSEVERQDLKAVQVSIEAIESIRNKKTIENEPSVLKKGFSNVSVTNNNSSQYRYQIEDVPWDTMYELALDREKLEEIGALDALLKGYKTPMLIPILVNDGEAVSQIDARLQLRIDDDGELFVKVYQVCKKVDFRKKFNGHKFTKEDRVNLLNSGNMGRVVDLIDTVTGKIIPSLISLDRLTNELISLRMEFVRIPDVICGVKLDLEQKQMLRDGKALFIENMVSKKGKLFSATVQFNADWQWVQFMFENKLRSSGFNEVHHSEREVSSHFRGVKLRKWQMDKLKAGETAYIKGLESRKGKTYQGYICFDKSIGRIVFSFKNPKKG